MDQAVRADTSQGPAAGHDCGNPLLRPRRGRGPVSHADGISHKRRPRQGPRLRAKPLEKARRTRKRPGRPGHPIAVTGGRSSQAAREASGKKRRTRERTAIDVDPRADQTPRESQPEEKRVIRIPSTAGISLNREFRRPAKRIPSDTFTEFLSKKQVRDLVTWASDLRSTMTEEKVRDPSSVLAYKTEHDNLKAEIESREESFRKVVEAGKNIISDGHQVTFLSFQVNPDEIPIWLNGKVDRWIWNRVDAPSRGHYFNREIHLWDVHLVPNPPSRWTFREGIRKMQLTLSDSTGERASGSGGERTTDASRGLASQESLPRPDPQPPCFSSRGGAALRCCCCPSGNVFIFILYFSN